MPMSADPTPAEQPSEAASVGLAAGERYRCTDCGNLTRFDVTVRERATRFWHVDLSGHGHVERTEVAERDLDAVTCHWCATGGTVIVEPMPAHGEGDGTA